MAQDLHLTFKAGTCETSEKTADGEPRHIKPLPTPGYIYLFTEDDLLHFCWRPRSAPMSEPELDLIMFAGDASFKPYQRHGSKYQKAHPEEADAATKAPTNGRLYVLSFSSSSGRHFFWLQSKSQSENNDAGWHSPRDLKIAEIVNKLLAGEDVDAPQEIAAVSNGGGDDGGGGDDTAMEDGDGGPHSPSHHRAASGGAGADATGGDIREEGEESREGGADGGRAAASSALAGNADAQATISSFLQSLSGGDASQAQGQSQGSGSAGGELFTTLADLLSSSTTISVLDRASESTLDKLLAQLPPILVVSFAEGETGGEAGGEAPEGEVDAETAAAVAMSLAPEQKRTILRKVLRSPQFAQSLGSLTMALRDGGLPSISQGLGVPVKHGGYLREQGGVPLGGGTAVRAFVEGFKEKVKNEGDADGEGEEGAGGEEKMQTD